MALSTTALFGDTDRGPKYWGYMSFENRMNGERHMHGGHNEWAVDQRPPVTA